MPKNYVKAQEWWEKAAAQGEPEAAYNLGVYYANGRGVQRDANKALEWFEKAAAQGHEGAKRILGKQH